MSRPWKHPKTETYWLRKQVPEHLQPLVGKQEVKLSLKTKDPDAKKREHLKTLADLEAQWNNLRAGPKTLWEREAHELAQAVNDAWLAAYRDNPGQQTSWNTDTGGDLWKPSSFDLGMPFEVRLIGNQKGSVVDLPGIATRTIARTPRTGLSFALPAPAAPGPPLAPSLCRQDDHLRLDRRA